MGTSFGEDANVLQEVQIDLDLGNAPELGIAGDGVAGLQDEPRGDRSDVAELDDLDSAGGIEAESDDFEGLRRFDRAVAVLVDAYGVAAEFEHDPAADFDDRFLGETEALERDATGNLDEEDLTAWLGTLADRLFDGLDDLDALCSGRTQIPCLILPGIGDKLDKHGTLDKAPVQVEPINVFVRLVDPAIIIIVDTVAAGAELGRRQFRQTGSTVSITGQCKFVTIGFSVKYGSFFKSNATGGIEADVNISKPTVDDSACGACTGDGGDRHDLAIVLQVAGAVGN